MKFTIIHISLLVFVGLVSCKPLNTMIAKKTGVFIEPKNESPESILSYCQKMDVNFDQLFIVKSEEQFESFFSEYQNIPIVFIFNRDKYLITSAVKTDCPWAMINLLDNTNSDSKIVKDTLLFGEILSHFALMNDKFINKNADYYILCTWAKFTPKMTTALFETINKQKADKKLNICHILLNVDLQESWESKK